MWLAAAKASEQRCNAQGRAYTLAAQCTGTWPANAELVLWVGALTTLSHPPGSTPLQSAPRPPNSGRPACLQTWQSAGRACAAPCCPPAACRPASDRRCAACTCVKRHPGGVQNAGRHSVLAASIKRTRISPLQSISCNKPTLIQGKAIGSAPLPACPLDDSHNLERHSRPQAKHAGGDTKGSAWFGGRVGSYLHPGTQQASFSQ